jgi:hypothetical protein
MSQSYKHINYTLTFEANYINNVPYVGTWLDSEKGFEGYRYTGSLRARLSEGEGRKKGGEGGLSPSFLSFSPPLRRASLAGYQYTVQLVLIHIHPLDLDLRLSGYYIPPNAL